ncbi:MAG: prepilin-type N-terminal cleavage/methylation domain-containing protein [Candidatus Omnitrophota bacterium]
MPTIIHNKSGLSLMEIMVVTAIFSIVVLGIYVALSVGQSSWFNTDANIEIQQNLRKALQRMTRELQESGFDKDSVLQVTIDNGTGVNGSDILRFSLPIICQSTESLVNDDGDIAHWGATLTWGCTESSCMDADDDCDTVDYKYISYLLDDSNRLIRRVLDADQVTVREDKIANDISDFQISSSVDSRIYTISLTAQRKSALNRQLTSSATTEVSVRNRG